MSFFCRYGAAHVLHRLPAVANIIMTQDYLRFAHQVMSSHDRANKQAELDVSPAMGDMLTEMQGCLKQLCGNSAVGNPEAVAQLIAEKVAAMNICSDHNRVQDNCDDLLALPAPADMAAPKMDVNLSAGAQGCTTGLIKAPALYDTSGNISSVQLAWSEWSHGFTQLQRGSSSSRLTPLWCWADVTPACTKRTDTCLSSLSLWFSWEQLKPWQSILQSKLRRACHSPWTR